MNLLEPEGSKDPQRAVASVILDNCFAVHGLRVIESQNGHFVSMPARKGSDGKYYDIAHPITKEASDLIRGAVLDEFQRQTWERQAGQEQEQVAAGGGRTPPRPARTPRREAQEPER